jgi:hypothetical protein
MALVKRHGDEQQTQRFYFGGPSHLHIACHTPVLNKLPFLTVDNGVLPTSSFFLSVSYTLAGDHLNAESLDLEVTLAHS